MVFYQPKADSPSLLICRIENSATNRLSSHYPWRVGYILSPLLYIMFLCLDKAASADSCLKSVLHVYQVGRCNPLNITSFCCMYWLKFLLQIWQQNKSVMFPVLHGATKKSQWVGLLLSHVAQPSKMTTEILKKKKKSQILICQILAFSLE